MAAPEVFRNRASASQPGYRQAASGSDLHQQQRRDEDRGRRQDAGRPQRHRPRCLPKRSRCRPRYGWPTAFWAARAALEAANRVRWVRTGSGRSRRPHRPGRPGRTGFDGAGSARPGWPDRPDWPDRRGLDRSRPTGAAGRGRPAGSDRPGRPAGCRGHRHQRQGTGADGRRSAADRQRRRRRLHRRRNRRHVDLGRPRPGRTSTPVRSKAR